VADATVPRTRQEEALVLPDESAIEIAVPVSRRPRVLTILWATFAVLIVSFLLFGTVRVEAGNWNGRRMRVTQIWERFVEFLTDQGASAAATAVVTVAAGVALIGGIWLVWLAFGIRDGDSQTPPGDAAGG
jgi:hypothetical protein